MRTAHSGCPAAAPLRPSIIRPGSTWTPRVAMAIDCSQMPSTGLE